MALVLVGMQSYESESQQVSLCELSRVARGNKSQLRDEDISNLHGLVRDMLQQRSITQAILEHRRATIVRQTAAINVLRRELGKSAVREVEFESSLDCATAALLHQVERQWKTIESYRKEIEEHERAWQIRADADAIVQSGLQQQLEAAKAIHNDLTESLPLSRPPSLVSSVGPVPARYVQVDGGEPLDGSSVVVRIPTTKEQHKSPLPPHSSCSMTAHRCTTHSPSRTRKISQTVGIAMAFT
eukprot:GILK01007167.1.p1 GENE.GILK01007167.1~~GILK01007167.1.p1  ORF type:complete len:243 (-),score=29.46 GILK01007167.1:113-841(-)